MPDTVIIANCGLVCSNCGAYVKGKCRGCHGGKPMHSRCQIKKCTEEKQYDTCADCQELSDLKECRILNNFIAKIFRLVFRSDRVGNLIRIRAVGYEKFQNENIRLPK